MRSLLAKSVITIFIVLSLGTSLAWASTSSRPGMFLYPVKQTTQKAAQVLKDIPTVEIRLTAATPPPIATADDQAADPTAEPTSTATATATSAATATVAPTPVRAVDKIVPTATAGANPDVGVVSAITPPPEPPDQTLSGGSVASSDTRDDQSTQRNRGRSRDDSSKNKKSSDASDPSDAEDHSGESSSGEHD